jgi:hypothetical protein
VIGLVTADAAFGVAAPGLTEVQVAEWLVNALPPLAPSVKVTLSDPVASAVDVGVAFTLVGAAGEPTATGDVAVDAALDPIALVAFTVHV